MAADRLTGFYPQSPASDPTVFLAGLVQLLAGYPSLILENLLSVHGGIPAKFKFLPTISEIREECERAVGPHRYAAEFSKGNAPQLEGPPREARPTMEQLKAKYGPNWGLSGEPMKKPPAFRSVADIASDIATSFSKAAE